MDKKLILDEELSLVSGGVLKDGWQDTITKVMTLYKNKFGELGKHKTKDTMSLALNDPTSPLDENDLITIYQYIDKQWDKI